MPRVLCSVMTSSSKGMIMTSQEFAQDRVKEGHMLCSLDGEFVLGIVVNHSWDAFKRLTKLTQDEGTVLVDDLHVHNSTRTPAKKNNIPKIPLKIIPC